MRRVRPRLTTAFLDFLNLELVVGVVRVRRLKKVELGVGLLVLADAVLELGTVARNKVRRLVDHIWRRARTGVQVSRLTRMLSVSVSAWGARLLFSGGCEQPHTPRLCSRVFVPSLASRTSAFDAHAISRSAHVRFQRPRPCALRSVFGARAPLRSFVRLRCCLQSCMSSLALALSLRGLRSHSPSLSFLCARPRVCAFFACVCACICGPTSHLWRRVDDADGGRGRRRHLGRLRHRRADTNKTTMVEMCVCVCACVRACVRETERATERVNESETSQETDQKGRERDPRRLSAKKKKKAATPSHSTVVARPRSRVRRGSLLRRAAAASTSSSAAAFSSAPPLRWIPPTLAPMAAAATALAGKTAIVTGSTSGIGLGIATALAGAGRVRKIPCGTTPTRRCSRGTHRQL